MVTMAPSSKIELQKLQKERNSMAHVMVQQHLRGTPNKFDMAAYEKLVDAIDELLANSIKYGWAD